MILSVSSLIPYTHVYGLNRGKCSDILKFLYLSGLLFFGCMTLSTLVLLYPLLIPYTRVYGFC